MPSSLQMEASLSEDCMRQCLIIHINWSDICSEWVLGNREDLVKDIFAEIQPENGEVMLFALLSSNFPRDISQIYAVICCDFLVL